MTSQPGSFQVVSAPMGLYHAERAVKDFLGRSGGKRDTTTAGHPAMFVGEQKPSTICISTIKHS